MEQEVKAFLKAKEEIEKKIGRGGIVEIAKKRGISPSNASRWLSAKRLTRYDKENMAAALAIAEEKALQLKQMTRAVKAA